MSTATRDLDSSVEARKVNPRPQTARKSTAALTPEARLAQRLNWTQEENRRLRQKVFEYQRRNQILTDRLDWLKREIAEVPHELDSPSSP